MNKLMMLAAAAATTLFVPVVSAPATAKPVASRTATIAEHAHIRTTLHGTKGPLLILIPGLSTPGAVWDETVVALKATHRLLVVEVKGFDGVATPANEQAGMMDGIVSDLSTDLKSRGINKAAVVGHSFGGLTAMKFALDRPSQVDRIVIVDSLPFIGTIFNPGATVETIKPQADAMRSQMLAGREAMKAAGRAGVARDPGGNMSVNPENRIRIANWSMKADGGTVAQAMYEDMLMDLRSDIANIKVPMAVLHQASEMERAQKRYSTDYAAQPKARLIPVDKTGHFIMLDQPAVFQKEIIAFVANKAN